MAQGALGDLVLALSADTAKFESDLGKAARVAEKELQKIVVTGAAIGSAIGDGIVKAAQAMTRFATDTVRTQSQLDDLADTVGGNVTQLDGLRRVAFVAGSDLGFLNTALMTLSRGLRSSSDEGNATVRAVKALGLNIEELRNMAPDQAMRAIAVAMNQFADGGEKAAAAQALLKGAAKESLPILKDLAEATDTNGKKTREQVEQSERLEKETRRLSLAFQDARDDLANLLIPTLAKYLEQLTKGVEIAGGFGAAIRMFGTINPFRSLGGNINELQKDLEALEKGLEKRRTRGWDTAGFEADIDRTKKQIEFLKFMQRQEAMALAGPGSLDARDLANQQKPKLPFQAMDEEERRKAREREREAMREAERMKKLAEELARIQAKSAPVPLDVQFDEMEKFWARQAVDAKGAAEEIRRAEEAQKRYLELQRAMAPRSLDQDFEELEKFWARQAAGLDKVKEKTGEVNDFAKSLGMTFSSAFEDAIIKGSSFRDVLKGIEQDIARIIIRQGVSVPAANAIGDLLSKINWGGGTSGAEQLSGPPEERAFGGSVSGGMPYLVGERGPELFVPGMSGTVVPNDALGGSVSIYQTINVDSRSDQASIALAMQRAKDAAVAEVTSRQQRRGDARIG
jgi:hypothetical protein